MWLYNLAIHYVISLAILCQDDLLSLWCGWDAGPFPDPDMVISVLLQTDLQAMMEDSGATQSVSTSASLPSIGDSNASNKSQERHNASGRPSNFNNQSASDVRNSGGPNSRASRLPPTSKRKDPESKLSLLKLCLNLFLTILKVLQTSGFWVGCYLQLTVGYWWLNGSDILSAGVEEEEDTPVSQNRPPPRDVFRLRQLQRARVGSSLQSGSTSGNSGAFSGERSGSSE